MNCIGNKPFKYSLSGKNPEMNRNIFNRLSNKDINLNASFQTNISKI